MSFNNDSEPKGELELQTATMPKDTNADGDIFGGWLLSQMDIAGAIHAAKIAKGRVTTVAVDQMTFLVPVKIGAIVSCYCNVVKIGNTSIQVLVEVWMSYPIHDQKTKVTEGIFIFVATDPQGKPRKVII